MASALPSLEKEGWLRKNHKGGGWAKASARRWFTSRAFHVFYYEDHTKEKASPTRDR